MKSGNKTALLFFVTFLSIASFYPCSAFAGEDGVTGADISVQTLMTYDGSNEQQSLAFMLREVYQHNPAIRAARAELKATVETLSQAHAGWRPSLSAGATRTYLDVDSDPESVTDANNTETELSLTFQQPLFRGGQTVAGIRAAENMIRASVEGVKATEQAVLYEAAGAYMGLLQAKALFDLEQNNQALLAEQFEAAQDRFDVGEATRTDVSQARARLANAEAGVITAQGNLRAAVSTYKKVTGQMPGLLSFPSIELQLPPTLDAAHALAEEKNPALLAARYTHEYAKDNVDSAFGALLPEVSLAGALSHKYDPYPGTLDNQDSASLSVSASIPLYQSGSTRARLRQAKYTKHQKQIEISDTDRTVRNNIVASWEALDSARAEIKAREKQIEASRIAREGVKQESELGTRTILDSLDADQEYMEAQVALVTAKTRERLAVFSLALNIGTLTAEELGFSELSYDYHSIMDDAATNYFGITVDIDED